MAAGKLSPALDVEEVANTDAEPGQDLGGVEPAATLLSRATAGQDLRANSLCLQSLPIR